MHVQIRNGRIDFRQILHIHFLGVPSDIFSKLVQGFLEGGAKFGLSHRLRFALPRIRVVEQTVPNCSAIY